ncbi:Tyrosine-protein kinase [Trema orientale]|uniref:Tyrosine-protein kinase n=1 Tax=Trema orientale TaxID=63057 RepID=A0A2P5BN10_TREOI|nr:Tyrosine-protein kinase [Trema orientale]
MELSGNGVDFHLVPTNADDEDPNSIAYKAPETRNSNPQATSKSDVYAFEVLVVELLTGSSHCGTCVWCQTR